MQGLEEEVMNGEMGGCSEGSNPENRELEKVSAFKRKASFPAVPFVDIWPYFDHER